MPKTSACQNRREQTNYTVKLIFPAGAEARLEVQYAPMPVTLCPITRE